MELLGTGDSHDGVEDGELTGGEGTDHDATGRETNEAELDEAHLGGDAAEADNHGALATSTRLVDDGEESISGVGDDGSGNTGNHTRSEGEGNLGRVRGGGEVDARHVAHLLLGGTLDSELSHGVGDLLEEDGDETRVEASEEALVSNNLGEGSDKTGSVAGVGHELDAGGLEGAEEDISNELGHGGRGKVDGETVLPGLLNTEVRSLLDLEELDTTELEPALDEVADNGGSETSGKSTHALLSDDLAEARDHAGVLGGLELHAGLDDIDGAEGTVGDTTADTL